MKKLIPIFLSMALFAVSCEKIDDGTAGPLSWKLTKDGTLTISGTGAMPDYNNVIGSPDFKPTPWDYDVSTFPYIPESIIRKVIISDGVTSIGNWAFGGRTRLEEVYIPESVTRIGDNAFFSCEALTEITIPEGVTSIGDWAFRDCDNLTDIYIPSGVTIIGEATFADCNSLKEITIPTSMTTIEESVFSGCQGLTEIIIPDNITTIGVGAFGGNNNLESVTIGSGVTVIGINAFAGNEKLTRVNIMATVPPQIGDDINWAFRGTDPEERVLYVPKGRVEAYKANPGWSREFGNIVEQS